MGGVYCRLFVCHAFSPSCDPRERFGLAARESSPHGRPFCYACKLDPQKTLKFISLLLVPLL